MCCVPQPSKGNAENLVMSFHNRVNVNLPRPMLILLVMVLMSFGVDSKLCSAIPENNITADMLSLLGFRQAITNDPTGILNGWNTSTTYCQWEGIKCSKRHPGRVVKLDLAGRRLSGKISSSVGNLTFLRVLNLSSNSLSAPLPPLNRLQRLQILDLGYNSLQDTIPDALIANCSNLRKIILSYNSLVGEIPPKLAILPNLYFLLLNENSFSGTIPSAFSNSSSIQVLSLTNNHLEGSIPDGLGKSSIMWWLTIGGNKLTGGFLTGHLNLSSSLQVLGLELNKLGGTLPPDFGDSLPNLRQLFLNRNMFEGKIPASLGNASRLKRLELENNKFTSEIPSTLGKLRGLSYLNLGGNNLEAKDQSWEFFQALTNCSDLRILGLDRNQLEGAIPDSIGNLSTNLQMLTLGGNKLFGIVPDTVGNLHSLIELAVDYNNLSGQIVGWIGRLTKLQNLNLDVNKFTGPIPFTIGNLTLLTSLTLATNQFEGPIPSSVGNLQQLSLLDLSNNNFQGSIVVEIVALKQLVNLYLSSNNLSGEIPTVLGQCQNLVTIQMDQNILTGEIPISVGNLKSLSIVNLSHNNLSGTIPAVLADLHLLMKLDLSYNHLQGEIPINGVFGNAKSIYLDGNLGLCGGVTDLKMPLCHAVSQRKEKVYYLVKVLIPIFSFTSLVVLTYIIMTHEKKKSHRTSSSLTSFSRKFPRVSYNDIARATGNFCESSLIGRGSCGSVYRGKLTQVEMEVAIKVFHREMRCADKSFVSECEVLRSIRHRYIIPILTACLTTDNSGNPFKALIYEFMPNGNLDTWLYEKSVGEAPTVLGLGQRISIVVNIADALAYLHHDSGRSIVHRDLKPSNILLDVDMNAYLGDFGIANLIFSSETRADGHSNSVSSSNNSSIGLKGTIGYIAPENAHTGQASTCGDVFSFGIVLLEILIGKRPTDSMFQNELSIVTFVKRFFPDQILDIMDVHLQEEYRGFNATAEIGNLVLHCLMSLVQVAISCTSVHPRERIDMREVAVKLHAIRTSYVRATQREDVVMPL